MVNAITMVHDYQPHYSSGMLKKGNTYKVADIYGQDEMANKLLKSGWAEKAADDKPVVGIQEPNRPASQQDKIKIEELSKKKPAGRPKGS